MSKLFIDCGRFDGVAIQQYCVDDSWKIYSFDVDPKSDLDLPKHQLIEKAVWIDDKGVEISLDPLKQATHIKGVAGTNYTDTKKVPSIDFSKWFKSIYSKESPEIVVCSMDIEGAEFQVLRKMLKDNTVWLIDVLDIEFHHRLMLDEDDETAKKLIQELSDSGMIVRLKVVLNK